LAFTKLKNCLACNSKNLRQVLDLNSQPLANSYLSNKHLKEKKYPLKVNACLNCNHLQLSIAVNPKKIYQNYDYVSGTTDTYKKFMKKFFRFCIQSNKKKFLYKNILDIGCNDGSQLDVFKSNNFKTYGVDPAKNIFKISSKKHNVICDFFNKKVVAKINNKFDFIISQNSFAHNPKPIEFLKNAKELMHEKSLLIIQTSQADMCRNLEFDTIYHEHINFFNINSMNKLIQRSELKLDNVVKDPIHGSSYLFVIKRYSDQKKIYKLLKKEKFLNFKYYKNWGKRCKEIVKKIKYRIDNISKKNIIIGYGAAAKANTFLNFSKVKFEIIIDDNKLKQNKFCPGSKIPIKSLNFIKNYKKNIYIVPLAWNFYKEIKKRVTSVRKKNKDKFVVFFPKFKIF
jgi:2-polyprenyl-3-methyl-5-hydroxy-6-metoxy-1,4-benzoquinol methylase